MVVRMDKENRLNTAAALWLAQLVIPMSETTRLILSAALVAVVARMVWLWVKPTWARYPAMVGALSVLALLMMPR